VFTEYTDIEFQQHLGERRAYDAVGYCIYCRASGVSLTDEHTIPDGMGGRHVLPKSSCRACQAHINVFEQYCMRTLFPNTRARWGIRASKKRPEPKRSVRIRTLDGKVERVWKPISELPVLTVLPVWPEPYAIKALDPPEKWDGFQWAHEPFEWDDVRKHLGAQAIITEETKPFRFAQFLAKIAHSHSIAAIGRDYFEPWLTPIILSQEPCAWIHLVGGSLDLAPAEPGHALQIGFSTMSRPIDGMPLGIFSIRLFPHLGAPTYHVVVGKMLRSWPPAVVDDPA